EPHPVSPHRPPGVGAVGSWPGAAAATASWPSTPATGPPAPHWWGWCGWPGSAGGSSRATADARAPLGWTTSKGDPGPGGTTHVTLVAVAHGFLTLERLRRPRPAASA